MAERLELPFPPRHLRREEAARYVGVSVDVFEYEVQQGIWPAGRRRGRKGGAVTWDRLVLEAVSNGFPEAHLLGKLTQDGGPADAESLDDAARAAWRNRIYGAEPKHGPEHRHEKAS